MKIKRTSEMGSKRQAGSDLNHTNWDKEEEPEDMGIFQAAPSEELKNRVIKKARRKFPATDNGNKESETDAPKSAFSGFSGFGKNITSAATSSPFSFLSKIPTTTDSNIPEKNLESDKKSLETEAKDVKKDETEFFEKSSSYYSKLKGLNLAVTSWIKKHVDSNALCILTPIFNDYERYLKEIQDEQKTTNEMKTKSDFTFGNTQNIPANRNDPFQLSANKTSPKPASGDLAKAPTFSFGKAAAEPTSSSSTLGASIFSSSTFSFGQTSTDEKSTAAPVFSFSSSKPSFSFGNVAKPETTDTTDTKNDEDEENEPPKVEFNQVVEEGSVYSKKCKVFVKAKDKYADHGIGTLHLKPIKDSEKTQLIVRADTSLGNILLNIILSPAIPASIMGKNNVMLVCIPKPDDGDKPKPVLLRVKTSEEAEELLEIINKYKK